MAFSFCSSKKKGEGRLKSEIGAIRGEKNAFREGDWFLVREIGVFELEGDDQGVNSVFGNFEILFRDAPFGARVGARPQRPFFALSRNWPKLDGGVVRG